MKVTRYAMGQITVVGDGKQLKGFIDKIGWANPTPSTIGRVFVPGVCCAHVWEARIKQWDKCKECGAEALRDKDGKIKQYDLMPGVMGAP